MSDHSSMPDVEELESFVGPYERWVFGEGRRYAYPPIRESDRYPELDRYLTAMLEIPQVAGPSASSAEADPEVTIFPPIWRNVAADGKLPTFLPFFWRRPPRPGPLDVDGLRSFLQRFDFDVFLGPFLPAQEKFATGIVEPRSRFNFPIDPATVHPQFRQGDTILPRPIEDKWQLPDGIQHDGKRVAIVGIIDDGIPFANKTFLDSSGSTRIEYFWDQAGMPLDRNEPTVPFGRELSRDQINALIARHGDEDALYRDEGFLDPDTLGRTSALDRFISHGALTLDILIGGRNQLEEAQLPDFARVIAVQLPNAIAWDTSGFGKDMLMLSAFHFILERASFMAESLEREKEVPHERPELPLVVNFSYGFTAGAHNGETDLEAAIGNLIGKRRKLGGPTAVVLPSGNVFEDRMHGVITPDDLADGEFRFKWRLQPNDRTSNYLELWFPAADDAVIGAHQVELVPPSGPVDLPEENKPQIEVKPDPQRRDDGSGDPIRFRDVLGASGRDKIGQLSADKHRNLRCWRVMIALAPTDPEAMVDSDNNVTELPRSEAGLWTVIVRRAAGHPALTEPILCWVQRDTDPADLRSGARQSYLQAATGDTGHRPPRSTGDARDKEGSFVKRYGSLNGLATHPLMTVVAGIDNVTGRPALYSSAGPVRRIDVCQSQDPGQGDVSCSSVSDRSPFIAGYVGGGTRSRSFGTLVGTSAAAPQVARRIARAFVLRSEADINGAESSNYVALAEGGEKPAEPTQEHFARIGSHIFNRKPMGRI